MTPSAVAARFAAAIMTLPLVLLAAGCWARFAPLEEQTRFVSALLLVVPGWVLALCAASLVRRPATALTLCALPCAVLAACLYFAS